MSCVFRIKNRLFSCYIISKLRLGALVYVLEHSINQFNLIHFLGSCKLESLLETPECLELNVEANVNNYLGESTIEEIISSNLFL